MRQSYSVEYTRNQPYPIKWSSRHQATQLELPARLQQYPVDLCARIQIYQAFADVRAKAAPSPQLF